MAAALGPSPGLGSAAAAAAVGVVGGTGGNQQPALLALPDAMLSEVMGNLGVKSLGRASGACRCLRDTVADELLWEALWEGPLPGGFSSGGKAAHAALWLLAKGEVDQTRVAVCEPASPTRTTSRRRVGDAGFPAPAAAPAGGGGGAAVAAAGFPVHVSCMAISGGVIATAAGPEITVWDLEKAAPRARFNVSGHGSVTCLLLRHGTLLAGDNSGYLRSYDVSAAGGRPLHEIRTHTDRVTAMDAFTLLPGGDSDANGGTGVDRAYPNSAAASAPAAGGGGGGGGGVGGGCDDAAGQQRRWDQGHGWGGGWVKEIQEDQKAAAPPQAAAAAAPIPPRRVSSGHRGSGGGGGDGGGAYPFSCAAESASAVGGAAAVAGGGRGRGHGRGGFRSLGAGFGGSNGGGGSGGGNVSVLGGLGEPLSRLGKRPGYAGRGQGDGPWDAAAAAAAAAAGAAGAVDMLARQQQRQQQRQQPTRETGSRGCAKNGGGRSQTAVLFTGSDDGTAKAWDAGSGRFVRVYAGHTRGVTCLQAAFTESYGPVLVTGGGDSAVIIWELVTGRCLEKLETGAGLVTNPGGAGPRVGCLQAYRNSIVVGEDRHVSVWSLSKGKRPRLARASFCEHQRPIRRLELTGRWIVTCSGDYVIRLWDSKTGVCVRELGTKSGAAITSFRLSGLCLLSTSLFDASVLMTSFSPCRAGKTETAPVIETLTNTPAQCGAERPGG